MTAIRNVIVGTAGHIDHGKSSVVKALTGIDPDRLEEERRRGMTIDLGFARYIHESGALVGIIDVPGHERFIKNMVAGATSVDVVMLVVAADDGVMPQTREHLQILGLLGARRGLVVITKIDLVNDELRELALEDIADFVQGTFLEHAPMLPVSTVTGDGLDELRTELDALINAVEPAAGTGPFRMPIQRVFSAKGHGTVVTGVPVSGEVAPGDELEVVDLGQSVRVRAVQAYGDAQERGHAGHSTALNVSGVSKDEVTRGCVVAAPNLFRARRRVLVAYSHVHADVPLRNNHPVRFHVGTAEIMGRAVILDGDQVDASAEAFVQLRLDDPVVVAAGDRCLLREAASLAVLGGGAVLATSAGRLKRFKDRVLDEARRRQDLQGDPERLLRLAIELSGRRGADRTDLAQETSLAPTRVAELVAPLEAAGTVVPAGGRWLDAGVLEDLADEIQTVARRAHKSNPLLEWIGLQDLRAEVDVEDPVLQAALQTDRRFETAAGGRVRLVAHSVQLSAAQRAAREALLAAMSAEGAPPCAPADVQTGLPPADSRALIDMLVAGGEIVPVGGLLYHGDVIRRMQDVLVAHGRARDGEIHIPTLRDELGTTRKYLIPLLEFFDTRGVTVRRGDRRILKPGQD